MQSLANTLVLVEDLSILQGLHLILHECASRLLELDLRYWSMWLLRELRHVYEVGHIGRLVQLLVLADLVKMKHREQLVSLGISRLVENCCGFRL